MKPTTIGAGISGLSAGLHLHRKGFTVKIIEASDRVGGRIKTDVVDGFRLDQGFQVLPTLILRQNNYWIMMPCNLKLFCQERQFYTMVVSSKLLIRSGDLLLY
jgi:phytoene dehydrogenase-like protein